MRLPVTGSVEIHRPRPLLVLPRRSVSLDGEGVLQPMPGHSSWWGPPARGVQSTSQAWYCCVWGGQGGVPLACASLPLVPLGREGTLRSLVEVEFLLLVPSAPLSRGSPWRLASLPGREENASSGHLLPVQPPSVPLAWLTWRGQQNLL